MANRIIPTTTDLAWRFGPISGSELWSRIGPLFRATFDPWWRNATVWKHMFNGGEHRTQTMSVDEAFARAGRDVQRSGTTLFGSVGDGADIPGVHVSVSHVGRHAKDPRTRLHSNGAKVIVSHAIPRRDLYRARFELLHELLVETISTLRSVTNVERGVLQINATLGPVPTIEGFAHDALMLVEPKTTFLARFDDPTVLDRVSFDEKLELDDLLLIARSTEGEDVIEMAEASLDETFELTRAAKPGTVNIALPWQAWGPDVFALLERGERQLYFAGYHPGDKIAEYTCAINEPTLHLRPQEIIELAYCGRKKQLPDGRPLERVRVVFVDRDAAYRERRPLLDSQVEVYFLGTDGELVPVTD